MVFNTFRNIYCGWDDDGVVCNDKNDDDDDDYDDDEQTKKNLILIINVNFVQLCYLTEQQINSTVIKLYCVLL